MKRVPTVGDFEQKSMEFEFALDGEKGCITGVGTAFGIVDRQGEVIDREALKNFSGKPLPMLWQHRADKPIGVWDTFLVTDKGLELKGHLLIDEIEQAKEAYALIKAGVVLGLSIGFRVKDYFWADDDILHFRDIELLEVSVVTIPANPEANITGIKSELTIRDAEKALVTAGFSHRAAKEILSKGFKSALVRDEQQDQRDADIEILNRMRTLTNLFLGEKKNG